ncbi:putative leucine-rich repeat-containing protein DDB_G0290503 isoform X2 [Daktulosphaira vitifoliae]|uniref:putative leucine-rich repeat-containing protein DDB_G0290503 isoform X2 n=1 Tax=Daktulosphaira vitifoliae TaxID=58002 RepID=UPI0021AAAAFB|nr:putative leucine-rich repeat-containing protein DDB_G0290503 isoform X2 [Daktulosphaira vitifoliae]
MSESAEPGWLRLSELAIGDGGVCVTSLIKDKIREYMLNEKQQTTAEVTATTNTSSTIKSSNGETCVRRIGNSLDLLLRESRNAGHAVPVTKSKIIHSVQPQTIEENVVSTTMNTATDNHDKIAKKNSFSLLENEMQISRMPIPADECASSEMSVDINHSHNKSDSKNNVNTNGENHQKLNGISNEKYKEKTNELSDSIEQNIEEDAKIKNQNDRQILINDEPVSDEKLDNICSPEVQSEKETSETEPDKIMLLEKKTENSEEVSDNLELEHLIKDDPEEQMLEKNNSSELIDENNDSKKTKTIEDDLEEKLLEKINVEEPVIEKNEENKEDIAEVDNKVTENSCTLSKDNEFNEAMEVDDIEINSKEPVSQDVDISDQDNIKEQNHSDLVKPVNLTNGELNVLNEIKSNDSNTNEKMNEILPDEDDKYIKSADILKIAEEEEFEKKCNAEEDICSEVSIETPSPKQTEEPIIARKRSAASHDELSALSGASSDNDLPKTKKLRCDDDISLLKDDTRERLIKNIVQSSGKSETELTRNVEKIQNEIKVITEIAQNKRDELVTLIRLQKLKEEIIERLMIKIKEIDATKTDNSKDWNLPEMFQINLSQPEHILNEKNIVDIIDTRDPELEKSSSIGYEQNSSASSDNPIVKSVGSTHSSNMQPNEWILSDKLNRISRIQRPILPKPITNNQKEGRQGPILDVKLIIADHRSKNPETAIPKRGRRKVPNDFSVPTSTSPLRYPNPLGFPNSIHHPNDVNYKTHSSHIHGISNNIMEQHNDLNRFKDVPAFPEVTLHPVSQPIQHFQQQQQQQQSSLLHGILTKGAGNQNLPVSLPSHPTTYSPTLARLLTAPERCKQMRSKQRQIPTATVVSSNSQSRNEITITPVQSTSMSSSTFQQKTNVVPVQSTQVDDEDASDRLVIDEGQDSTNVGSPSSAPQCQGCMQKPAQFVCAGCGNQWYCSKDCQIDAWDDHSEVCSG